MKPTGRTCETAGQAGRRSIQHPQGNVGVMSDVADCELPTTEELLGSHVAAIRDQAERLCQLPAGWDQADAMPVNSAAAAWAVRVAAMVTCPECLTPVLSPTRAGNVMLDWTWHADHVEIEVGPGGRLEVLVDMHGSRHEFYTTAENDDHLGWIAYQVTAVGFERFTPPN